MARNIRQIGGFTALNAGVITDCYSAVKIKSRDSVAGFCVENSGKLTRCLFRGHIHDNSKNDLGGLCLRQGGSLKDCLWIKWDNENHKDKYRDWSFGLDREYAVDFFENWCMTGHWAKTNDRRLIELIIDPLIPSSDAVIKISSKRDLEKISSDLIEGRVVPGTKYLLTKDIDMGGCNWTPIGCDNYAPFDCHFEGNGHTIKNFCVNATKHAYAGLFGCIGKHGHISNLTVDCVIKGSGTWSGPICGYNRGTITQCVTRVRTSFSRYTGGFVGVNEGNISRCCAHGKVYPLAAPILWISPAIISLIMAFVISLSFFIDSTSPSGPEYFAPIIIDPNAKPFEDTIPKPDPNEITPTNATFIMNSEMTVSSEDYIGVIGLRSPSWSTRGFVATVRVTKADLQKQGIGVNDDFTTIYQSGLIQPGFGVDVITLSSLPDGTKLPAGEYEFSVRFEFYNIENNEKSAVDSVVPLKVVIN